MIPKSVEGNGKRQVEKINDAIAQRLSESGSNGLLSASSVIMWLDDEIDRLEYPVGSLDIPRSDRDRIAKKLAKARKHIRALQDVGR